MLALSRIMVPVVFSDNCRGAVQYAASLACRFGAELTILHVLEPLVSLGMDIGGALEELDAYRRDWVSRELDLLYYGIGRRLPLKKLLLEGDAATGIVRCAETNNVDLIVMATHGHGPFRRLLLGSVTAKVLHDARCPVWTGAHMEQALAPRNLDIHRVACAVDLGAQTSAILRWGAGITSAWGAKLTLIHVLQHSGEPDREKEELERHRAELQVEVEICTSTGNLPATVCAAASQIKADLLVIGRGHGHAGGRLPSTAYAILRDSPCPVASI